MEKLILVSLISFYVVLVSTQQNQESDEKSCNVLQDLSYEYRSSTYEFNILVFKSVSVRSNFNYVLSPTSIWLMLAAIAEEAEPLTQQKLFQILRLPNDPCVRQTYYRLATTRAYPSNDVRIRSTRALLIDEGSVLNPSWYDFVVKNSLLDVVTAPIKYDPVTTAEEIKRIMSARLPTLDLSGNSVLLDTMDYNGLWTTAFIDAMVERAPFHDREGQQIGFVDLMKVKRKARMGYLKEMHARILELPIGSDQRYRMLFALALAGNDIRPVVAATSKNLAFEMFASLQESYVQVDVAIPRMVISSEIDVRAVLEDVGISDLWTDPAATRHISNPAALPSSFVQRSTLVLNNTGVELPSPEEDSPRGAKFTLDPILGKEFIADRPFLFGLFDAETYSCLLVAAYTTPTYSN